MMDMQLKIGEEKQMYYNVTNSDVDRIRKQHKLTVENTSKIFLISSDANGRIKRQFRNENGTKILRVYSDE